MFCFVVIEGIFKKKNLKELKLRRKYTELEFKYFIFVYVFVM